jgi:hypothetical protein
MIEATNIFSIPSHFHSIEFELNLNKNIELNTIQLKLHAMSFNIFIKIELNSPTKSIHFFLHFIIISSL